MMKTKLGGSAGWRSLDLEELAQQGSEQIAEASLGEINDSYGGGEGGEESQPSSHGPPFPEVHLQCIHLFVQHKLRTTQYELAPSEVHNKTSDPLLMKLPV